MQIVFTRIKRTCGKGSIIEFTISHFFPVDLLQHLHFFCYVILNDYFYWTVILNTLLQDEVLCGILITDCLIMFMKVKKFSKDVLIASN